MKVRKVTEADIKPLSAIYAEVYDNMDVGQKWDDESAEKLLRYWFKRNPEMAFAAEDNGKLLGAFFVDIKPSWDGNHLVDGEIFIGTKYQKNGYGTALMKHVIKEAAEKHDCIIYDTYTFNDNSHPYSWYEKLGFDLNNDVVLVTAETDYLIKKIYQKS